ncbi:hypothetical protein BT69DRAFT_355838 [Atractiella rhizophila]|nr:hypothetical protein BT69DRAFT_355838 [Atractiella rhizophila]
MILPLLLPFVLSANAAALQYSTDPFTPNVHALRALRAERAHWLDEGNSFNKRRLSKRSVESDGTLRIPLQKRGRESRNRKRAMMDDNGMIDWDTMYMEVWRVHNKYRKHYDGPLPSWAQTPSSAARTDTHVPFWLANYMDNAAAMQDAYHVNAQSQLDSMGSFSGLQKREEPLVNVGSGLLWAGSIGIGPHLKISV